MLEMNYKAEQREACRQRDALPHTDQQRVSAE